MTNDPKWTKGPWTLQRTANGLCVYGNVDGGPIATINECFIDGDDPEKSGTAQDRANADLIVAAPEMAEALDRILGLAYNAEAYGEVEAQERLALIRVQTRAVLAKIGG
jgi:hypothetical protein